MPQLIRSIPGWLSLSLAALAVGYAIWRNVLAVWQRPRLHRGDVVHQEWFASGWSERDLFTKLGGARSCLRLVVTREFLWVTSWPPFSFLAPIYDLEHVIPLPSIVDVKRSRVLWVSYLSLTYADESGRRHTLGLAPRHPDEFLQAIGRPAGGR